MLATACRRYAVAIVGIYLGSACAWDLRDGIASLKSKFPSFDKLNLWSTTPLAPGGEKFVVQQITLIIVASTAVVDVYPKITTAPLLRRKLGSDKWDTIHEGMQAQKRDGESCSAGYQLCAQSLNGGCCPADRVCGSSSCLLASTSAAVASGCGIENYVPCSLEDGGGCCPNNYKCQRDGCVPQPGVVPTQTCGASSYLCPASMNYGCCRVGMGCGYENCYSTAIQTVTFTQIITTTDTNSLTQTITTTITTAITPSIPAPPTTSDSGIVAKVSSYPVAVPKTDTLSKQASGGLTKVQLGGIIGGAVFLLLAILIAAFIIIKRLNKAIKVSNANSRSRTSGSSPAKPRPSQSNIDAMSVDPLIMSPSEIQFPLATSTPYEADSSPVYRSPLSPRSPPNIDSRGYDAVAHSESNSNFAWNRHGSLDATSQTSHIPYSPSSYFDIPPHGHSRRPSYHSRNPSNSSDQSQSSNIIELDAGADGDRRSSFQRAVQGVGRPGRNRQPTSPDDPQLVARRTSQQHHHHQQQQQHLTGGPSHPDWQLQPDSISGFPNPTTTTGPGRGAALGYISEAGESRIAVDASQLPPLYPLPPLVSPPLSPPPPAQPQHGQTGAVYPPRWHEGYVPTAATVPAPSHSQSQSHIAFEMREERR